jgi:hypothetical protein
VAGATQTKAIMAKTSLSAIAGTAINPRGDSNFGKTHTSKAMIGPSHSRQWRQPPL